MKIMYEEVKVYPLNLELGLGDNLASFPGHFTPKEFGCAPVPFWTR